MVRIHIYLYILYILIYIVYIDRYVFAPSYITQLSKFFQYFITQSVVLSLFKKTDRYNLRSSGSLLLNDCIDIVTLGFLSHLVLNISSV